MASTNKSSYGTNNQAITVTLTSLANNGQQGAAAVDNTSNLFLDVEVAGQIKTNAAGTSSNGFVNVYAAGTANGGTNYTDGVTGTNASQTLSGPPNVRLIGVITANANAVTYTFGPFTVAGAFNGLIPDHWALVFENKSGAALDASVGSSWYQGFYTQAV